ncbi:hypothetical protein NB037_09600 [Rathayibacter sp. ZW T2_19]|uniref:Uncharacterized protein n=1 Tax=Rathayibacter rubneri TaxID=2950106 RepID=A0A9X2DXZ0_9MICO|nr:hypothetical protein [Rathayibacter rubneri]MCM6762668.1 hypothetical protein [Rathayibacter rubneri]
MIASAPDADLLLVAPYGFEEILISLVIGGTIAGVIIGVVVMVSGRDGYSEPESTWLWIKPVLVAIAALGLWSDVASDLPGAVVFTFALVIGLICGLTVVPPLLDGRDWILSGCSYVVSVLLIVQRLSSGWEVAAIYLTYVAALAAGVAFAGLFRLVSPLGGIAFLSGVMLLDFIASPFGYSMMAVPQVPVLAAGVLAAIFLGVAFRVAPVLMVVLSGIAVQIIALWLQVLIFFASESDASFPYAPDWAGGLAFLGCALGYAVLSLPARMLTRMG